MEDWERVLGEMGLSVLLIDTDATSYLGKENADCLRQFVMPPQSLP